MPKLTSRKVETVKEPGMHGDGEGLYLNVASGGSKSWILRATVKGRLTPNGKPYRVEIGLGPVSLVTLAEARAAATPLRKLARQGINPLDEKRRELLTFHEATQRVYQELLPTWRSPKHGKLWLSSFENHVFPKIGNWKIETIGTAEVLSVLTPIWTETNDTARRMKQRLALVFDWAKGHGHYPHENPVNGVKKALPTVKRRAVHMAAMNWQSLPKFMSDLGDREGVSARTLDSSS